MNKVLFSKKSDDILGTANTITQVKKIARKYLDEEAEEAIIMYYDQKELDIFFLESC